MRRRNEWELQWNTSNEPKKTKKQQDQEVVDDEMKWNNKQDRLSEQDTHTLTYSHSQSIQLKWMNITRLKNKKENSNSKTI